MCIWDSCVYQKVVLCFLIHKSYVRSIKRYCFDRKYAAISVQIIIIIIINIINIIINIIIIIIINTNHMKFAASFILFGSILFRCLCGCMFCILLFHFVNYL